LAAVSGMEKLVPSTIFTSRPSSQRSSFKTVRSICQAT